jgi:RNA polymerase sigma-70 factor (ECF subfamily)
MDQGLVLKAKDGDPEAFRALAIASHPRLFKAAFGILRDRALAEDATQRALVNVWRHFRGLRDPGSFEGWSYRILLHACYSEARRRPAWVPEADLPPGREPVAADEYGRIDDRDELERAFRRLSLDHRAVVVLHHLADLPLESVAEVLEVKVGTVKSRLHRAMAELRAAIEADARSASAVPLERGATR